MYEITRLSCIASAKATRKTVAGAVDEIVFAEDDDIFKDSTKLTGLVIDVRINSGGSDCLDDEPVGRAGGLMWRGYRCSSSS